MNAQAVDYQAVEGAPVNRNPLEELPAKEVKRITLYPLLAFFMIVTVLTAAEMYVIILTTPFCGFLDLSAAACAPMQGFIRTPIRGLHLGLLSRYQ